MNKNKLQRILGVFQPDVSAVDFSEFDENIAQLKKGLKNKIQVQTIEDVNRQLEKFRQKLELGAVFNSFTKVENEFNTKIGTVAGLMDEQVATLRDLLTESGEASNAQVSQITGNIETLRQQLEQLNGQKDGEFTVLKGNINQLQEFSTKAQQTFTEIEQAVKNLKDLKTSVDAMQQDTTVKDQVDALAKMIDLVRKEFSNRIGNLQIGGGNANRNITIGGNASTLSKYGDINVKAGANVTITYSNNNVTKQLDVTVAATGGSGTTRSINSISADTTAGATAGTDYVYLVSGTTTLTIPTAVGNSNLYTVKNVGVGVVTVAFTGGETCDGSATLSLPVQYTSVDLISDTAGWNVT